MGQAVFASRRYICERSRARTRIGKCADIASPHALPRNTAYERQLGKRHQGFAGILLVLAVCTVAFAPRSVGAQATDRAALSVRHTISAQVGTVTEATLSAPRRPAASELAVAAALPLQMHLANTWVSSASIKSNVSGIVVIESAELMRAANSADSDTAVAGVWHVVSATGQLVPWSGEPVTVAAPFAAGRHELSIWLVAPNSVTAPPLISVRVSPR